MSLAVIYVVTVDKRSEERRVWVGCAPLKVAELARSLEAEHFVVSGGVGAIDPSGRVRVRSASEGAGRLAPGTNDGMLLEAFLQTTGQASAAARNGRALRRGDLREEDGPMMEPAVMESSGVEPVTLHEVLGEEAVADPKGERMAWSLRTLRAAHAFYAQECRGRRLSLRAMAKALLVTIQCASPEMLGCLSGEDLAWAGGETRAAVSARGKRLVSGLIERRGGGGHFRFQKKDEASASYAAAQQGNRNRKTKKIELLKS